MAVAYISLGSNQGDRLLLLSRSLELLELEPAIGVTAVSSIYETAPVGGPRQGLFLNACVQLDSDLSPVTLLRKMLAVEETLGRIRRKRWGPRTIDLDLLLYGNLTMRTPSLELPHPRMSERDFILVPLSEIAPDLQIPGIGQTVRQLLAARPPAEGVTLYKESGASKGEEYRI